MKAVTIDRDKCIGCKKCIEDCVSEKIGLVDGKAQFLYERCIECGHCYAICPVNAVSLTKYGNNSEEVKPISMTEFDSDKLLLAMKSRRTIRKFKDVKISDEMIDKIIEAGRYCPTGTNAQDFSFTVIKNTEFFENEAVKLFRTAQKVGGSVSAYIRNMTIDDNFFFKKAPLVIVVNGKGSTSVCLASSYMELMAESMGLGVLYSGFFVAATKFSRKISSALNTPKGHSPVTTLVIGYPDVEYQRVPERNEAVVNVI